MKTLLIDNYDSFTHNLFQLLAEVNGEEPILVRNDEATWDELASLDCDNVVISPGPGRPDRNGDFGVCAEVIRRCEVPLLGVCLGHQGLATAYGGAVTPTEPMHGRLSQIDHRGAPLFAGIPPGFEAVRYHSLRVAEPLPPQLRAIAWRGDLTMALEHRSKPQWGVQFHPESICTEYGRRLLENFRGLSEAFWHSTASARSGGRRGRPRQNARAAPALECSDGGVTAVSSLRLLVERLDRIVDAEAAFVQLYAESKEAFWLDSSNVGERGRFSFSGDASGPLAARISYRVDAGEVEVERCGEVERRSESIFEYLERELGRLRPLMPELPFEFDCGFVGWFGYELKAECGGAAAHGSPHPDAAFLFADRILAFDHLEGHVYLLCLADCGDNELGEEWIAATKGRLEALTPLAEPGSREGRGEPPELRFSRSRERYLEEIGECKRLLAEGETYEVCLTNKALAQVEVEPLELYRALRRVNPAPFSAFLRFGEVAVLSSSPERFLRVGRDRRVEAMPVKGTSRRGDTAEEDARLASELERSEKDRAENLMIVDLLRNDLGSVCEVGTVSVPHLIEVESYETVHQLVSTVRGRLREGLQPTDCIRACFPPGSMTGAPKLRTMRIIDELEGEARGVYSGAIGYLGLGGGCDLSVVIRTIVLEGRTATIGAGGAIVVQSEAEDEYEEMMLKARAPMQAIHAQSGLVGDSRPAVRSPLEYLPAKSLRRGQR